MSNLRFVLAVTALFGFAFVGVTYGLPWASKGFSVIAMRAAPAKPDAQVVKSRQGGVKDWTETATAPEDNDPGRDRMRQTAISAANAYALSPCDHAVRAAFIVSAATYLRAAGGPGKGAAQFATPTDLRVRKAIESALDSGDVGKDEFPADIKLWPASTAKSPSYASSCGSAAAMLPR